MDALVVEKVRKTFEAENAPVRALRGANLVVPSGDFVALMGPSGCGKSTLLNLSPVSTSPTRERSPSPVSSSPAAPRTSCRSSAGATSGSSSSSSTSSRG